MDILELLLIAVGLSMDAFAVSVCKGLSVQRLRPRHYLLTGAWFGGFQALMPFIGFLLGSTFDQYINAFDHWIAFVLLALIGGNMVKESLGRDEECHDDSFDLRTMFLLAVATSIDFPSTPRDCGSAMSSACATRPGRSWRGVSF